MAEPVFVSATIKGPCDNSESVASKSEDGEVGSKTT